MSTLKFTNSVDKQKVPWALNSSPEFLSQGEDVNRKWSGQIGLAIWTRLVFFSRSVLLLVLFV